MFCYANAAHLNVRCGSGVVDGGSADDDEGGGGAQDLSDDNVGCGGGGGTSEGEGREKLNVKKW